MSPAAGVPQIVLCDQDVGVPPTGYVLAGEDHGVRDAAKAEEVDLMRGEPRWRGRQRSLARSLA